MCVRREFRISVWGKRALLLAYLTSEKTIISPSASQKQASLALLQIWVILHSYRLVCTIDPYMGHRLPQELLLELRTYLHHFDDTGHLGEIETVREIKRRLRERISEVEAQLRMNQTRKGPDAARPNKENLTSRIAS